MARHRYLITYDISDPRRLRHVCKTMEEYGDRIQYSVFICDLSRTELLHARTDIEAILEPQEDSVVIIDLGEPDHSAIIFIGRRRNLPTTKPKIV